MDEVPKEAEESHNGLVRAIESWRPETSKGSYYFYDIERPEREPHGGHIGDSKTWGPPPRNVSGS